MKPNFSYSRHCKIFNQAARSIFCLRDHLFSEYINHYQFFGVLHFLVRTYEHLVYPSLAWISDLVSLIPPLFWLWLLVIASHIPLATCAFLSQALAAFGLASRAIPGEYYEEFQFQLTFSRPSESLQTVCKIESSVPVRAPPSEVCPAGKFHWHFTCGFYFRNNLRTLFSAVLWILNWVRAW